MRFTEFISEAGSPAQQAAIAIAMKKAGKKPKNVSENDTAAGINKMFNNLGDPVFSNLQRVALLAMQGRQQEASGRLQSVIKDASPAVQKKIIDAVNSIKPVTINGKIADSSTIDKSKQHRDWIINTFIPWVQSLLGKQDVAENNLDKYKKYTRPVVKTTPKIERTTNPSGRSTDHVEWIVTSDTGEKKRFTSKRLAQEYYNMCTKQSVAEGEYDSRKPFGVRYKVFAGREGRMTTKEYWTTSEEKLQRAVDKIQALDNFYEIDGYSYPKEQQGVAEEWSQKYKKSINCSHPKGFSQKAHCAGKKKHNESIDNVMEMTCPDCGMCQSHGDNSKDKLDELKCWSGFHRVAGTKAGFPGSCAKNKTNEEQVLENLHKWFKEKWVRFGPDGKIRGDCARGSESEGKPKCLPQSKAHSLGKKGRASAASRKRREDPNANRSGKAINVSTKGKGK
jgi:hypothetical protein